MPFSPDTDYTATQRESIEGYAHLHIPVPAGRGQCSVVFKVNGSVRQKVAIQGYDREDDLAFAFTVDDGDTWRYEQTGTPGAAQASAVVQVIEAHAT